MPAPAASGGGQQLSLVVTISRKTFAFFLHFVVAKVFSLPLPKQAASRLSTARFVHAASILPHVKPLVQPPFTQKTAAGACRNRPAGMAGKGLRPEHDTWPVAGVGGVRGLGEGKLKACRQAPSLFVRCAAPACPPAPHPQPTPRGACASISVLDRSHHCSVVGPCSVGPSHLPPGLRPVAPPQPPQLPSSQQAGTALQAAPAACRLDALR